MEHNRQKSGDESRVTRSGMQAIVFIAFVLTFGLFYLLYALKVATPVELAIFFPLVVAGVAVLLVAGFLASKRMPRQSTLFVGEAGTRRRPGPVAIFGCVLGVLVLDAAGIFFVYNGITKNDPYILASGIIVVLMSGIMTWVFALLCIRSKQLTGSAR